MDTNTKLIVQGISAIHLNDILYISHLGHQNSVERSFNKRERNRNELQPHITHNRYK